MPFRQPIQLQVARQDPLNGQVTNLPSLVDRLPSPARELFTTPVSTGLNTFWVAPKHHCRARSSYSDKWRTESGVIASITDCRVSVQELDVNRCLMRLSAAALKSDLSMASRISS